MIDILPGRPLGALSSSAQSPAGRRTRLPITTEEHRSKLEPVGPPTLCPPLGEAIWVPAMQHAPLGSTWSGLMADQRNNTERRIAQDIVAATGAPACSDLTLSARA